MNKEHTEKAPNNCSDLACVEQMLLLNKSSEMRSNFIIPACEVIDFISISNRPKYISRMRRGKEKSKRKVILVVSI